MTTSLDSKFAERSESIIAQFGFKNLKAFIKNQASIMLMAKIEKYEAEDRHYQVLSC
ncbi:MAG: hypothetical protein U5R49_10325 [Deltaproteobacteria bacterium]|nr:hypothetical protein [Deltaproteobacteria bacterium]